MIHLNFEVNGDKAKYYPNRVKQWFAYLRQAYPDAADLFREIRVKTKVDEMVEHLKHYRDSLYA